MIMRLTCQLLSYVLSYMIVFNPHNNSMKRIRLPFLVYR